MASIVQELGFSNPTYFYKIFGAKYEVTPKAYRQEKH
ncbi:MAG: AraC family transcriptional regulator [Lachnospiraceae bacterium]|nr:AraC family transcriptional regulator [Lachnospiraceae bacterium]